MEVIAILLIAAGFGGLLLMLVSCGIEFFHITREPRVPSVDLWAMCISLVLMLSVAGLVLTAINHL